MPDTPDSQAPSAMNTPVETDSFCIECGYNLRGLPCQGLCPECGTLKSASLRPDLLQYADPAWRDSICRGLTLLSVALWLTVTTILISAISYVFSGIVYNLTFLELLGVIMRWTITASSASGFWLMGTSEPINELDRESARYRHATRLAAVVTVLSFITGRLLPGQAAIWATIVEQLAVMLGIGSSLLIVGAMSLRLPSTRLHARAARRARGVLYVGACALIAVILYRTSLHPASITAPYVYLLRTVAWVAFGFLMLYMVFVLFTVTRFRPMLREIDKRARAA